MFVAYRGDILGWAIFAHAIRLVFSHLGAALRISALIYICELVLFGVAAYVGLASAMTLSIDPVAVLAIVVASAATVIGTIWIAVAWHRYVLLDEMPGAVVARFNGNRILAYFGNSVLLGLIALAIGVVISLVLVPLMSAVRSGGPADIVLQLIPLLLIVVLFLLVGYRLGIVLPASAIGKPLRFGEAWAATRGATGTLIALAILSAIGVAVLRIPEFIIPDGLVWLTLVWGLVSGWIELIVGISILTTLYGVYVEKRPLA